MLTPNDEQAFVSVKAREKIYALLCNYARGLDRLIPSLVRSAFFDDATTDYGSYKGNVDGFIEFAFDFLDTLASSHHMLGQAMIDVDGDVAFGEVYFQAHHRIAAHVIEKDMFVAGRYIDRYECRRGVWRIAHRSERADWVRTEDCTTGRLELSSTLPRGARAPEDISCKRELLKVL